MGYSLPVAAVAHRDNEIHDQHSDWNSADIEVGVLAGLTRLSDPIDEAASNEPVQIELEIV
jgi:hypothetical protein